MVITSKIQDIFKKIEWGILYDVNHLPQLQHKDLDNPTRRFIKSEFIEKWVEKHSNNTLCYVNTTHCDYTTKGPLLVSGVNTVELKSQTSKTLFCRKGLRKKYVIKLSNSNGEGINKCFRKKNYADVLLAVYSDGAFIVDLSSMGVYSNTKGDGISLEIPSSAVNIVYKNKNTAKPTTYWLIAEINKCITDIVKR